MKILYKEYDFSDDAESQMIQYLRDVSDNFNGEEEEVATDIKMAIEEKLDERLSTRADQIAYGEDIDALMCELGQIETIVDADTKTDESQPLLRVDHRLRARKLYRDGRNRWISGVASGLAARFDLEPWVVRGIFIVGTFMFFQSVLIYLLLWLFMPLAVTKTDFLRMTGKPVTVDTIVREDNDNYISSQMMRLAKWIMVTILLLGLLTTIAAISIISMVVG